MARGLKYNAAKQTAFAKEHYNLNGVYLTDVDQVAYINTENVLYNQYSYTKDSPAPIITKIIEVKYKASEYIKNVLKKHIPPSQQMLLFAGMMHEINISRSIFDLPRVELFFVVQTEGQMPFHVYQLKEKGFTELNFEFIKTVTNKEEYKEVFEPK